MDKNEEEIEFLGENLKEKKEKTKKEKPEKTKREKRGNSFVLPIILFFVGAALMYLLIYYVLPMGKPNTTINRSEKEVTITENGIADAVDKLYDAVVVITSYKDGKLISGGTGFVYKTNNNNAYILTNNHVINGATDAKVEFTDGKEVDAKIIGGDTDADIAVLSVASDENIQVASLGNSENARLGDTVFTIGSPISSEYSWTVTRGILSGKDRMVEVSLEGEAAGNYAISVLQTDASINSGNSGGPLANANGEVIGVTNMKLISDTVEGIGFAIPIEDAITIADDLLEDGKVERPLLGVSMMDLENRYNLYQEGITLNTELTEGVVVVKVQAGSPADKAGLKRGDIIIGLDDDKIDDIATLRYKLYKHKVGDTIKLKIEREGKEQTVSVKLTKVNSNER